MSSNDSNQYPMSETLIGKIVIATGERGLTYVGRLVRIGVDPALQLPCFVFAPGGAVVRRWGTDAGLAQLVAGKRAETILDYSDAPMYLPAVGAVSIFPVKQEAWEKEVPLREWQA